MQEELDIAPVTLLKNPVGQFRHTEAPSTGMKAPFEQKEHDEAPSVDINVPMKQKLHTEDPSDDENIAAKQGVHFEVLPAPEKYVPPAQAVQELSPESMAEGSKDGV